MKKYIKHTSILFLAILLVNFTFAQDFKFTAATSRNTVKTGDRFQIQFSANQKVSNFKARIIKRTRILQKIAMEGDLWDL